MLEILKRAEAWMNALTVDPVQLREQYGMKGKKHFVEWLVGYRSIAEFYRRLPNGGDEISRICLHVRNGLGVLEHSAYHDLGAVDNQRFAEDATSYLFACQLAKYFGFDDGMYRSEIRKILPRYYEFISTRGSMQRMASIRRLGALGLPATDKMESLVERSQIRQRKPLSQMLKSDVYVLIHELVHLTEMGRHPPQLLNAEDKTYLSDLFGELLYPTMLEDIDLLAEVVEALVYLRAGKTEPMHNALDWIARCQNENGSFGAYEAERPDLERQGSAYDIDVGMYLHTTIVCLKALVACGYPLGAAIQANMTPGH